MTEEKELLETYRREMLFIRLLLVPYVVEFNSDPEWEDFCILTIYVWEARHFEGYILRIRPNVQTHDPIGNEHVWMAIDRQRQLLCYLKTGKMVRFQDLPVFRGVSKKWIESPGGVEVKNKVDVSRRYGEIRKYYLQEWKAFLLFQDSGIITYGTHFWQVQPVDWELSKEEVEHWIFAGYYDENGEYQTVFDQYQQICSEHSEPLDEPEWMLEFRPYNSVETQVLHLSLYPAMALWEKGWWDGRGLEEWERAEELQKEVRWLERLRAMYGAQLFDEVEETIREEYRRAGVLRG